MKSRIAILFTILFLLAGCGGKSTPGEVDSLSVTDGSSEQQYSVDNLKRLGAVQADLGGGDLCGCAVGFAFTRCGL